MNGSPFMARQRVTEKAPCCLTLIIQQCYYNATIVALKTTSLIKTVSYETESKKLLHNDLGGTSI